MIFPVVNAAAAFLEIYNALPPSISSLVTISWIFGAAVFMARLLRG